MRLRNLRRRVFPGRVTVSGLVDVRMGNSLHLVCLRRYFISMSILFVKVLTRLSSSRCRVLRQSSMGISRVSGSIHCIAGTRSDFRSRLTCCCCRLVKCCSRVLCIRNLVLLRQQGRSKPIKWACLGARASLVMVTLV